MRVLWHFRDVPLEKAWLWETIFGDTILFFVSGHLYYNLQFIYT